MRHRTLAAAAGMLAIAVLVTPALAGDPKKAKGFKGSFTTAFNQCTAPTGTTHAAPLAFPGCAPPVRTSVGNANDNEFNQGNGSASFGITVTGTPDVKLKLKASAIDNNGSPAGNTAQSFSTIRITDNNCAPTSPCTVVDLPFAVTFTYAAGAASVSTSANAVIPGSVVGGKAANTQIPNVVLTDGDTVSASSPCCTAFAQGIFVP